ncbi:outer membrane lipid asymmetry maintenance protein MlaD [Pantoea sp. Aalb]|uniref:outer membrane lipid asymmetry maintenance protein MlaD n=1 Tax=Pantoea sp. Aalb TaxID=2576762 RepID=UPI001321AD7E|nr:outer membrane lipid asymmetry maintenance protein MlaD [Pantoea sp. Aalb]MXP67820.1 outer membrane lipid asymmetry maintenance protein MlaD [Pantoea sp. Aalb]
MQSKKNEILVGLFMLFALISLLFFSLHGTNFKLFRNEPTWKLYAIFSDVGGLKISSPVKIGGVVIGRVINITLDEKSLLPRVTMRISNKYANKISDTSSLVIRTQGLLGEQFLALNLGFDDPELGSTMLKDGSTLRDTKSVLILEDIIGKFFYKNKENEQKL